ncbi:unnamed protein product [Didymodactylos carnosus]|uniref:Mono(ADP-ribosyl)transferase n=1 Tax=Didymodactylos carnosus TaxID=1234261 RepID=A0A8S2XNT8_9BILA|nr:unnamed protein product [Didymodactylos carnosus]
MKAQKFGNALFIIDATAKPGLDISHLSHYDEEEVILPPATAFTIMKVENTTTKTYVYLKLLDAPFGYDPDLYGYDGLLLLDLGGDYGDWHSSLAASSLSQLFVSSSSSDEHCCDESEMSSCAMEHLRDR